MVTSPSSTIEGRTSMARSQSHIDRRARASRPKVKTGCRTCKIRKVKCDEARPSCMRCIKFGCGCDGYENERTSTSIAVAARGNAFVPPRSEFKPIFYQPATELFKSEQEYRYFRLFCNKTALQLSGCFNSTLWNRLVLQACHHDPSIRHAVIAIAALNMTLESKSSPRPSGGGSDPDIHHQFALQQYSKAVTRMRKAVVAGGQDLRSTLITSLVVICFESFHGDHESALAQVRTGLHLVKGYFSELTSGTQFTPGKLVPDVIEDELIQAFGRLDIQTMSFTDSRPVSAHREMQFYGQTLINTMPATLESLKQARLYLEILMQRLMHFKGIMASESNQYVASRIGGCTTTPISTAGSSSSSTTCETKVLRDDLRANIEMHRTDLLRWQTAFAPLFARSRSPAGKRDFLEASALRLHYVSTYFAAAAIPIFMSAAPPGTSPAGVPVTGPLHMRASMPLFKEIVGLSRVIIEHPSMAPRAGAGATCPFTFDFQVIVPLYIVGTYCPHTHTRREALRLLLHCPRREGLWDGVLAGRMVEFIIDLEEEAGLDGDFMKEESKMRGADIALRYPGRSAHLQCFMPVPGTDRVVVREKLITW